MKKVVFKILFTFVILMNAISANAVQFDVLVLPAEIFSQCDNYFCFPEPSEIAVNYIISDLEAKKNINTIELSNVRAVLNEKPELKLATQKMLTDFEQTERTDFVTLKSLAKEFGVKSVMLVSAYAITDRSVTRRGLWEVLEISSAFKITYPFNLTTTAVLTDTVNETVMWSGKYNKTVSDSNGYFLALNRTQAASHLEKIKQYYRNNVAKSISQNVNLRLFPKDVRTFKVKSQHGEEDTEATYTPNALEKLSKPKIMREIEEGGTVTGTTDDDFIFEF